MEETPRAGKPTKERDFMAELVHDEIGSIECRPMSHLLHVTSTCSDVYKSTIVVTDLLVNILHVNHVRVLQSRAFDPHPRMVFSWCYYLLLSKLVF